MHPIYNHKKILNLSSLILLSVLLFFWDIYFFYQYYKIKYLAVLLVPFYINKYFIINNKNIFFILLTIFFHKLFLGYFYNFKYDILDYTKLLFFGFFVLFSINNFNLFIKYYEKITFSVILIFLISYIVYLTFSNIEDNFVLSCYNGFISRNNFIFKENSHFGFTFIGIFFYSLFQIFYKKKMILKKIIYISGASLIFINYSTSFLLLTLIISFLLIIYHILFNKKFYPFVLILIISFSTLIIDKQCKDRLFSTLLSFQDIFLDKFGNKKNNKFNIKKQNEIIYKNDYFSNELPKIDNNIDIYSVSSVVYLNSFLVLKEIIPKYPFGIGFDNIEKIYKTQTIKTKENFNSKYWNQIQNLNLSDGTNNLVKLLGEFGFFSIFIFYFFIKFILSSKANLDLKLLIIAPFIAQLIFRGAGYFNGGFIFYLTIIIVFHNLNCREIKD